MVMQTFSFAIKNRCLLTAGRYTLKMKSNKVNCAFTCETYYRHYLSKIFGLFFYYRQDYADDDQITYILMKAFYATCKKMIVSLGHAQPT
jgi:hypothetical protein